jgi:predicted acetyltransferase
MRRAFGAALPTDEELALSKEITEFDRTLAFFDGSEIVATAGIFSYQMTVPGGGSLACAGVTRVAVLSTHRRRGLLTAMMRRQLDDVHERGEPLAALYASEAPIYGRFGYGLATYQASIEIDRSHAAFAGKVIGDGRLVMVDVAAAVPAFTGVWAQARRGQPGMLGLEERWIKNMLTDLEAHREGASPQYRVLYQAGDQPAGFAVYRIKMGWDAAGPNGTLRLEMLIATTAEAYAALWRHVLDVDLMARVSAEMRPVDEPVRFLLADSRQPRTRIDDGIWLRLVDVAAALASRRYAVDGRLVFHVRDDFCPWNDGLLELQGGPTGAEARRTKATADIEIAAADLGALYLAGNKFHTLLEAGRLRELRPGAVARADAMFATDRAPWCPSHF